MSPEEAARGARCAAKAAELERLHGELAEAERCRLEETHALETLRLAVRAEVTALAGVLSSEEVDGVQLAAHVATSKIAAPPPPPVQAA